MQELIPTLPGFAIAVVFAVIGFILGMLATPISTLAPNGQGLRLRDAFEQANHRTDWLVGARIRNWFGPKTRPASTTTDQDELVIGGLILLAAISAFVKYADQIVIAIEIAAASLLLAATITLITLRVRKVVDSAYAVMQLIGMYALVGLGIFNGILLLHPVWGGDPLRDARDGGLGSVGSEGMLTLIGQVISVPMVMGTLVVSVMFCLASVTAAFIGSGAMWAPMWLSLYWTVRWSTPTKVFWWTIGIAIVSLGFASGWLPHLLHTASGSSG